MSDKITLYAYNFASRADRVRWTLNELDLDYDYRELDPFNGETSTDDFLQLNPQRKIPVLTHGDKVLTDSLAIMEYLAMLVPSKKLIPTNPDDVYRFRNIIYYTLTEVEAYLWTADQANRLSFLYNWPEGTSDEAFSRVEDALPLLYQQLQHNEHVAGDHFSLADIYIFQILLWSKKTGLQHPEHVTAYMERMMARPRFPHIKQMLNEDVYSA